jgi:hypothetical protein
VRTRATGALSHTQAGHERRHAGHSAENGADFVSREHERQSLALHRTRHGLHPRRIDVQDFCVKEVERAQGLLMTRSCELALDQSVQKRPQLRGTERGRMPAIVEGNVALYQPT